MADASGNAAASSCKLVDRHSAIRNPPPAEDEIDWCGRGGGGRGGGTVNSEQCSVHSDRRLRACDTSDAQQGLKVVVVGRTVGQRWHTSKLIQWVPCYRRSVLVWFRFGSV